MNTIWIELWEIRNARKWHVYWLCNETERMGLCVKKCVTLVCFFFLKILPLKASSLYMHECFVCIVFASEKALRRTTASASEALGCSSPLARPLSRKSYGLTTSCTSILSIYTTVQDASPVQCDKEVESWWSTALPKKSLKTRTSVHIYTTGTLTQSVTVRVHASLASWI